MQEVTGSSPVSPTNYLFIPGTVLIVITVSFNLVGDALRDTIDPHLRGRG